MRKEELEQDNGEKKDYMKKKIKVKRWDRKKRRWRKRKNMRRKRVETQR
jgi:hypothetical protein